MLLIAIFLLYVKHFYALMWILVFQTTNGLVITELTCILMPDVGQEELVDLSKDRCSIDSKFQW